MNARATQILKQSIWEGWLVANPTATGAQSITVYAGKCKVARIKVVTGSIQVLLKDNVSVKWDILTNAAEFITDAAPIQIDTSLVLTFNGAGNAFVIYKPETQ